MWYYHIFNKICKGEIEMMPPKKYPTDLTDSQFKLLRKTLPAAKTAPVKKEGLRVISG